MTSTVSAAGTLKFEGSHSMGLLFREGVTNEADEILLRFRTKDQVGPHFYRVP